MAVAVKTVLVDPSLVGICEFTTTFRLYFSFLDRDVHWGYDLDFDPWPSGPRPKSKRLRFAREGVEGVEGVGRSVFGANCKDSNTRKFGRAIVTPTYLPGVGRHFLKAGSMFGAKWIHSTSLAGQVCLVMES